MNILSNGPIQPNRLEPAASITTSQPKVTKPVSDAVGIWAGRSVLQLVGKFLKVSKVFDQSTPKATFKTAGEPLGALQAKKVASLSSKGGPSTASKAPKSPADQKLLERAEKLANRSEGDNEKLIDTLKNRTVGQGREAQIYEGKFGEEFHKPENREASRKVLDDPKALRAFVQFQAAQRVDVALKMGHEILDTRKELKSRRSEAKKNPGAVSKETLAELDASIKRLKPLSQKVTKALDRRSLFEKIALPRGGYLSEEIPVSKRRPVEGQRPAERRDSIAGEGVQAPKAEKAERRKSEP